MKAFVKQLIRKFGIDIRRYHPGNESPRDTVLGSMRTARAIGLVPQTIIDVGAARGEWSSQAAQAWQDACYILIDPLEENIPELERACYRIRNATYKIAVVAEQSGDATINVHPDLDGSSLFLEREANINGTPRRVPMICLNELRDDLNLTGPFLIKADVQGAEMRVLHGATRLLPETEMIILEVLLFDFFQGNNPQLYDLVAYLKTEGFVVWDIWGMEYRMIDFALSQVDIAFVKETGLFRRVHQFATETQRQSQLTAIAKTNSRRIVLHRH